MTRRVCAGVILLVGVILMLAVVPLGWSMVHSERTSFRNAISDAAASLSAAAEEALSDHHPGTEMTRLVRRAVTQGDCAAVYDITGRTVDAGGCSGTGHGPGRAPVERARRAALSGRGTHETQDGHWLTVAVPVGEGADTTGVAVLSRSTEDLDDRILIMLSWLVLIAIVGIAGAAMMSLWLARWIGRPLHTLDNAAQSLGDGDLGVRAPANSGPPELRRLATTFNTMAARTESLVHGHRAVVADVSHQLRTPLAALRLRLDLLADDAEEQMAIELAGAQDEIVRLSRLVDGLLAVARSENSVPRLLPVPIDRLIAERAAAWEPVADERHITLSTRGQRGLVALFARGGLEQVLDNLIDNALEAVQPGGHVRLSTRPGRDSVVVRVADDGPGMTPAARSAAFRRFGNPEASGAGLGLAIVHRLVTANGGTVALQDSPGGGLTVVLTLRAHRGVADHHEARDQAAGGGE
ncbi:two-component sensor histidine kinase [Streptomyces sulfonofaciens]|uniref:histidine kinase n=1 Tax=Streptomyces sulfonofaciens TaxID=68272 RepID=A0A919G0D2_9ACTN|nr:two-component sensor histidine kinase [Streptomyces sulfonofaciens]